VQINFECHSSTIRYEVYRTSTVEEKFTDNKREYAHCFNATARCDRTLCQAEAIAIRGSGKANRTFG